VGAHSFDTSVPVLALARVPQDAHQTTAQGRRRRAFDRPMRVDDGRATRTAGRDLWCVWGRAQKINLGASERSTPVAEKTFRRQHIIGGFRSRHTHCGDPWRRTRRPSSHIWRHIEGTVRRHHHRMRRRHPRRHVGPSRPQFHRRVVIIDRRSSRRASASNSTTKTTTPHAEISKPPRSSRTRRRSYTYKNRCDTRARRRTSPCCSRSH
jgi:hypothetical protein